MGRTSEQEAATRLASATVSQPPKHRGNCTRLVVEASIAGRSSLAHKSRRTLSSPEAAMAEGGNAHSKLWHQGAVHISNKSRSDFKSRIASIRDTGRHGPPPFVTRTCRQRHRSPMVSQALLCFAPATARIDRQPTLGGQVGRRHTCQPPAMIRHACGFPNPGLQTLALPRCRLCWLVPPMPCASHVMSGRFVRLGT